jgi:chaperonin GroES
VRLGCWRGGEEAVDSRGVTLPNNLIVVGDRVLIEPADEARTRSGLFLPAGAHESEGVRTGKVLATGPGAPLPTVDSDADEPWKEPRREPRFIPMQVRVGDEAVFFKKAAIEVRYEGSTYLVVPQSAVLVVTRDPTP